MKDNIFDEPAKLLHGTFEFNDDVANVFDDMIARSIPAYSELQHLLSEFAVRLTPPGGTIYDLGCSTGNSLLAVANRADTRLRLVGLDAATAMIERCRTKLKTASASHDIELVCADVCDLSELPRGVADTVLLCLVAQFLRPLDRPNLLQLIHRNLKPGGALLFVEKVVQEDRKANSLFVDVYHSMKRSNGYSETEIAKKREALENVLVPFRPDENLGMLANAGFDSITVFYSMLSFQGYLALKRK